MVVAPAFAVVLEVVGDAADRVGFLACEPAFGDGPAEAFDDLADHAAGDPLGVWADERFGFGAALWVPHVRDFSELVQRVQEVEDERDVLEGVDDALLGRAFAVGEDLPGFAGARGRGG